MENVNSKIANGAAWMLLLRMSVKGIGFVSTLFLARLLTPEDFGVVALAMSVFALIELLQSFSFGVALIQNQNTTDEHFNTAWTLQVLFGLLAAIIIVLVSSPVAQFYDNDKLASVMNFMGLLFLVNAFKNIGVVYFQKDMTFQKEFNFGVIIKLIGFVVTIPLAFYLRDYWALLYGMLALSISTVILSFYMHPYRPAFDLRKYRELFSFSSWLMLNNILNYVGNNLQNFLLAKFGGLGVTGLYKVSSEVASLTTAEIVAPINKAAFPAYSKVKNNLVKLRETYLNVLSTIAFISIPSAAGIASVASVLVPVLLGNQWLEAIPLVELLALASGVLALNTNASYIFLAVGKQKINTYLLIIRISLFVLLLTQFIQTEGAYGVVKALLITNVIMMPLRLYVVKKYIYLNYLDTLSVLYRPILSSVIMYFLVSMQVSGNEFEGAHSESIVFLLYLVSFGLVTFCISSLLLWFVSGKPNGIESVFVLKFKSVINNL